MSVFCVKLLGMYHQKQSQMRRVHSLQPELSGCRTESRGSKLGSGEVVAVSQAPSPESNPYSPLPVTTMVGT
ncbi:unnamed protein product [Dracunculus medinensis]|uniref:Uncharacterized protein n=1 Tax=Dracunculus medinensis TaxID=318479 RepID=A0A0N4ULN3_DRAME|nr:unnamed protein product [Dracunculus medinensis]